jgi:hypothetical protein
MAEVRFEPAWRRNDPKIAADAIALWRRLGVLPANLDPAARAEELCLAAYGDGELVGVSTMVLETVPQLRCRLGFCRCLVAPEHRQQGLARKLGINSRALLAQWSQDNPQEKVLGMATIVESQMLDEVSKIPVWPNAPGLNGLVLVGYTPAGQQVRVSWFEHARLE